MEQITVYGILSWADYTLIKDLGWGWETLKEIYLEFPPPPYKVILFKPFLTSLSSWPHTSNFVKLIPHLFDNIDTVW